MISDQLELVGDVLQFVLVCERFVEGSPKMEFTDASFEVMITMYLLTKGKVNPCPFRHGVLRYRKLVILC